MTTPSPAPPCAEDLSPDEPSQPAFVDPAPPETPLEQLKAAALAAFHREALAAPTALHKMLGSRAGDMLAFSTRLFRELQAEADVEGSLVTILEDSPIVFEKMLQLDRQAERFLQFLLATQRSSPAAAHPSTPGAAATRPRAPR
jgi:hypothetical protein